jgi:hypothetical protein
LTAAAAPAPRYRRRAIIRPGAALAMAFAVLSTMPASAQTLPGPAGLRSQVGVDALVRAAENPLAGITSVSTQYVSNFNVGPNDRTQEALNLLAHLPVRLTEELNLVTRTTARVVSQPGTRPGAEAALGLGTTQTAFYLSPNAVDRFAWGAGALVQFPTTTDERIGSNLWGAGPAFIVLQSSGRWLLGGIASNVSSLGGQPRNSYNMLSLQPILTYVMPTGSYLSSSPLITANWEARSDQRWTVPVAFTAGQVFRIGGQAFNAQLGASYNVVRPDIGPDWQLRAQISLLFAN